MLEKFRADTPACAEIIHLNNAGSALTPLPVHHVVRDYLDDEAATGGYEAAAYRAALLDDFYPALADMLHAAPHNIAWAGSATDAYSRVLSTFDWKPGDVILTTNNDYVSNQLAFFSLRDRMGVRIVRAGDLPEGGVDPADMALKMDAFNPVLVAVTHIPTNSGLVQPIETIGQLCRERNLTYLVDACQSAGQKVLDVRAIGCDFLTATMRKYLRGPRGAGFLYVSDRMLEKGVSMLLPDMIGAGWTGADQWEIQSAAQRFEYFEYPPALKAGAAAAVRYYLSADPVWVEARCCAMGALLRDKLRTIKGIRVLDHGPELCGIVTAFHPDFEGAKVLHWLRDRKVHTSVSTRSAAWIDFDQKGIDAALRLSVHYYNTETELDQAVARLDEYICKGAGK